jgi:hypothetical protein
MCSFIVCVSCVTAHSHHQHWVRVGSTHDLAANEYSTHVFSTINRAGLGGKRPRLDMDKVEKL